MRTPRWVAGVALILPFLGMLIAIAGGIYGIYLLYLGLPHTMKCPPEKAGGYTAVIIIIAIVLSFVIGAVIGAVTGVGDVHARRLAVQLVARFRDVHVRQGQHRSASSSSGARRSSRRARRWKPRRSPAISRRRATR